VIVQTPGTPSLMSTKITLPALTAKLVMVTLGAGMISHQAL
jgi:hypothetical protein